MPSLASAARMRRVVVTSAVLGAAAAAPASAATLTITPTIQGSGTIVAERQDNGVFVGTHTCATLVGVGQEPTNATITTCPAETAEGNDMFFGRLIMTPTPAPGWRLQSVTGTCPFIIDNVCRAIVSSNPASWTVKATFVEIVPVTITSAPPAFTNNTKPPVSFSSTVNGTTFTCSVDGAAATACASPFTPPNALGDGPHAIAITGHHNGDPSLEPQAASFTVDTAAPVAALDPTSGPGQGALQAINTETFKFNSSEPGTFLCRLDTAAFADCTSPFTLTRLTAGAHTFDVRARDRAGNLSAPATRSWSVAASDDDGDGFNARIDCNDQDPAVHPGATDLPDNGVDENCDGADAHTPPAIVPAAKPTPIVVTLSFFARASSKSTKFTRLQITGVPSGATVKVVCKGKGCPKGLTGKGFTTTNARGTVSLATYIKKAIPVTAKITVTVSKPGSITTVKTLQLRKRKSPVVQTRCLSDGATKPTSC